MDNNTQQASVSLSQEELFVLLAYLQTESLMGLNGDILQELSEKEIRIILGVAERALIAREFLIPGDDQDAGLQITPALLAVVGLCVKPEKTLIATYDRPDRPRESFYFHQAADTLALHTIPLSGIHQFAVLDVAGPIEQIITALLGLDSQAAPMETSGPIYVSQAIITQARDAVAGETGSAAAGVLTRNGLSGEFAQAFATTLVDMKINITLVFLDHAQDGSANADGFTLLVGANGCWRLEPDDDAPENIDQLVITPLSATDVFSAIKSIVQHFYK